VSNPIGYWFGGDLLPHGDGRRVTVGCTLTVNPPLKLCERGLHYSEHPMDALTYATCSDLWLIEDVGDRISGGDKCCTTARRHLAKIDAECLLREFARWCALGVLSLWDAPAVVREYLESGDGSKRAAALSAASAAVSAAASDAAWAAVSAAASDAAWAAASDAARDAAWAAASDAARDAQRAKLQEMVDAAFSEARGGQP